MAVHASVLLCMFVGISIRVVAYVCMSHGLLLSAWVCSSAGFQQQSPGALDDINICTNDRGVSESEMAMNNSNVNCNGYRSRGSSVRQTHILYSAVQSKTIPLFGVKKQEAENKENRKWCWWQWS